MLSCSLEQIEKVRNNLEMVIFFQSGEDVVRALALT